MNHEMDFLTNTLSDSIAAIIDIAYQTLMKHPDFAAMTENQRIGVMQRIILKANMRYLSKMPYSMNTNDQIDEVLEINRQMLTPDEVTKILKGIADL